jgi:glyoxylase-like metal-dependent hydrolase (beta-lactamase superfamily II)
LEVANGIHQIKVPIPNNPLGNLNCYLIEGKNGWLMVDTGWYTVEAFSSLQTGLRELGLGLTDISTMVVTHVHPDHFGLAGRIKQVSRNTQLLTHRWESDLIESRYVRFSELHDKMTTLLALHGVPPLNLSALSSASLPALEYVIVSFPDRVLYGGEIISTGIYDLEVIWTPGHSPGHICLYEPQNEILFSGDHILPTITPNVGYNVQSGDDPLGDYLNALHKLQNLPVNKVLPAHENIFTNLKDRIAQIVAHHDKRKAEILKILSKGPRNAWEIAPHVTWDVPGLVWGNLPPLHKRSAVTEVIAHLESMRYDGDVNRVTTTQGIRYEAR